MTNDKLRALADALDSDPARGMAVAADYLRAQAEPKPIPASGDDLGIYKRMADSYRNVELTEDSTTADAIRALGRQ